MKLQHGVALFILAIVHTNTSALAASVDLSKLSLKELTEIEVTLASKKSEPASEASAAVYVITSEDIKKSGMNSVPELLKMVPGIQVSRIDSSKWAIGSRGFAREFANKLLVLLDGRTIYHPMFSGVVWDENMVSPEDIERIEVIRGPGATLWGANAVNGIINIVTKKAEDSQGGLVSVGAGNFEKGFGTIRYGGSIGEDLYYKAYANGFLRDNTKNTNGKLNDSSWDVERAGFKSEWHKSEHEEVVFQGDGYVGAKNDTMETVPSLTTPFFASTNSDHQYKSWNVLGKYSNELSDTSKIDFQAYYDFISREFYPIKYDIHTIDFDFQHSMNLNARNELVWGLGYRNIFYSLEETNIFRFDNSELETNKQLFSAFVQNKYSVIPEEVFLTIGSKFEHNDYTGFELQPNVRISWLPTEDQTLWAAISKAVRSPNRTEDSLTQIVQGTSRGYVAFTPNKDFKSEELVAYEVGYRVQPRENLSFDIAAFYNDYNRLRTSELSGPMAPDIAVTLKGNNGANARAYGFELAANWNVTEKWELAGSYSMLEMDIGLEDGSRDTISRKDKNRAPKNMFNIRSSYDIADDIQLTNGLYFIDDLPGDGIPAHLRFDAQLAWKPLDNLELRLIGQDLLDDYHPEFGPAVYNLPTEIPRSIYGKVTVTF